MVIQSSSVSMNSKRSYVSRREESIGFEYWGTPKGAKDEKMMGDALKEGGISKEEAAEAKNEVRSAEMAAENPYKGKSIYRIRSEVINYLLRLFFGDGKTEDFLEQMNTGTVAQGFGGTYTKRSFFYEKENTNFRTKGSVVTADGRKITFGVEVEMSRSFATMMTNQVQFGAPRVCDPLVINLDTNAAQVSDQKFFFDLDADGTEDSISMPERGSGFLALDKNGNGIIDDGRELFGVKSGDGFGDLEEYDIDKNGWIDEADAVFDKLRIWVKDEKGQDRLIHLKEAGVGAICLQNASTQFALNSHFGNRTNAYIRKTGIFLYENGESGTIQHIDLVQ